MYLAVKRRIRGRLYTNKNLCKWSSLTEVKYLNSLNGKI
nr:MAG TPA: hypothetical protein [Bacteriophage sp.]